MVDGDITIRPVTVADIPDLVRLRRLMFEDMGCQDSAKLGASDRACQSYFAQAIPAGEYHGWLAVTAMGQAVASGGLVIDQHPPGPGNLSGKIGYIMNVVTIPTYRRQGIARWMMHHMLAWLAERGIERATLHASDMGRCLYQELGFVASNEMRLKL
jgi:GNAT superfamily N-acetyltransferase